MSWPGVAGWIHDAGSSGGVWTRFNHQEKQSGRRAEEQNPRIRIRGSSDVPFFKAELKCQGPLKWWDMMSSYRIVIHECTWPTSTVTCGVIKCVYIMTSCGHTHTIKSHTHVVLDESVMRNPAWKMQFHGKVTAWCASISNISAAATLPPSVKRRSGFVWRRLKSIKRASGRWKRAASVFRGEIRGPWWMFTKLVYVGSKGGNKFKA